MAMGKLPDASQDDGLDDGVVAEINITPLTDIFLVLLIIFMVTSSAIVDAGGQAGVKVDLPGEGKGAEQLGATSWWRSSPTAASSAAGASSARQS